MGQGLKGAADTYNQFTNTVFGPLSKVQNISPIPILIGVHLKDLFGMYKNDHIRAAKTFHFIYAFLRKSYFPEVAFGLIYLLEKKTKAFMDILELLGFKESCKKLRPLAKH